MGEGLPQRKITTTDTKGTKVFVGGNSNGLLDKGKENGRKITTKKDYHNGH